ncbi:hypothetical protein NT6N_32430 [Oceaniferula spumae]|uniref:DUF4468 domain-containing protein n=1 Tax=Oceaniferula spumae TaxID=2979115 RepID=A0AAT9FQI0_9BACT
MKKIYTHLAALSLMIVASPAIMAQDTANPESTSNSATSEEAGPRRFWQANLPGGSYVVALDRISSISKHTYIIDGNLRVTEVVIDTSGNSLARFYYIIPVSEDAESNVAGRITERTKGIIDKVGERTGVDGNSIVAKQYPTTTHAKTVEYRISDEGDLDKLLGSVRKAWMNGAGKKFTIRLK